ncbi:hypothetical protein ACFX13_013494 [Malus domestica]
MWCSHKYNVHRSTCGSCSQQRCVLILASNGVSLSQRYQSFSSQWHQSLSSQRQPTAASQLVFIVALQVVITMTRPPRQRRIPIQQAVMRPRR